MWAPLRMREVELRWGKVLLLKEGGEFHALGHKCPHYGAPLVKGEILGSHGQSQGYPGQDSFPYWTIQGISRLQCSSLAPSP